MATADESNAQAGEGKKPLPIKTIAIVAGVLLIEAVAICAVFMLSGQPADVQATEFAVDPAAMGEQPAEVLVVDDKFQNNQAGVSFIYDAKIVIRVKTKHLNEIEAKLDKLRWKTQGEIATIYRRAQPSHLNEPELSTIRRQVQATLDQLFGLDPETGGSYILEVLIPNQKRYRSDL